MTCRWQCFDWWPLETFPSYLYICRHLQKCTNSYFLHFVRPFYKEVYPEIDFFFKHTFVVLAYQKSYEFLSFSFLSSPFPIKVLFFKPSDKKLFFKPHNCIKLNHYHLRKTTPFYFSFPYAHTHTHTHTLSPSSLESSCVDVKTVHCVYDPSVHRKNFSWWDFIWDRTLPSLSCRDETSSPPTYSTYEKKSLSGQ